MPVHTEALHKINDPQIHINFETLEKIAKKYELDLIVLHGSRAKGYARTDSDVDIVVRTRRKDYMRSDLEWEANWFLDLLGDINGTIEGPEGCDVRLLNQANGLFMFSVARHGVPLYEAEATTFVEFVSYAVRRHDDEEPLRLLLREHQRNRYGCRKPANH